MNELEIGMSDSVGPAQGSANQYLSQPESRIFVTSDSSDVRRCTTLRPGAAIRRLGVTPGAGDEVESSLGDT